MDKHIVFFHGIRENYESCERYAKSFCSYAEAWNNKLKFIIHVHRYPRAFQRYMIYLAVSSIFLLGVPTIIIFALFIQPITFSSISLLSLSCIFLSIASIIIPFAHKDHGLFKSSIKEIEQLIQSGVKSESIVLFGHSFGGAAALETLKYFANRKVKLGGAIFANTFSSFEEVLKSFPLPQTKILSILPSFIVRKLLKIYDIDLNLADDIKRLYNEKKLDIPITIINHPLDELIKENAQLGPAVKNLDERPVNQRLIDVRAISSNGKPVYGYHNDILIDYEYLLSECKCFALDKIRIENVFTNKCMAKDSYQPLAS